MILNNTSTAKPSLFLTQQLQLLEDASKGLSEAEKQIEQLQAKYATLNPANVEAIELRKEIKVLKEKSAFFKTRIKSTSKIVAVIYKEDKNKAKRINQTKLQLAEVEQKLKVANALLKETSEDEKHGYFSRLTDRENLDSKCERLKKTKERYQYTPNENALLEVYSLKKYFPMAANFLGRTEADKIYANMLKLRRTSRSISHTKDERAKLKELILTETDSTKKQAQVATEAKLAKKLEALSARQTQLEEDLNPLNIRRAHGFRPIRKGKNALRAVDGVSFSIERGKTLGIVGESGCGKTTMGRSILRLHEITGGAVFFKGMDITQLKPRDMRIIRPQIQIIFQDPYSSLSPRLTVGEIIGEAVRTHNIVPKSEYKDYVIDIMKKCGLQPLHFNRYPHEFSGGQRQRICIARALALKPDFVVCDEPVSALDVSIQAQIINLLKDLQKELNLTYLFISHDLSVVEHISDEIAVMYLGNMVEKGPKERIFANPMHPYTKALFSAVPVPDPDIKMNRIMLKGDIPSPANPPLGCKFHTRCSHCMDICRETVPDFTEYEKGHFTACHLYNEKG